MFNRLKLTSLMDSNTSTPAPSTPLRQVPTFAFEIVHVPKMDHAPSNAVVSRAYQLEMLDECIKQNTIVVVSN